MLDLLANEPTLFITCATILGLLVGSFLNVVILRLPVMLEQAWKTSAAEVLEQEPAHPEEKISLISTRSACPKCGHKIPGWHNIPVLSYLILRGRCAHCKAGISLQYPLVEIITAALSGVVAWHFGFGMPACLALLFTWTLIAATGVDWRTQFLPDVLTLPLVWLGLLASLGDGFATPKDAIVGAVAGYMVLWLVFHSFRLLTGKEGMGYGDFKLLAALGAWMGWQMLPMIILLSSIAGMIIGIGMNLTGALKRGNPMPFGPFLAIAGWLALIAGDTITGAYLQFAGFGTP